MSIVRALLLLSVCSAAVGCLPKKSEVATCNTDVDCTNVSFGLRCDTARGLCVCDPATSPSCAGGPDAAVRDVAGDSTLVTPAVDAEPARCVLSSACSGATPICTNGQCVACTASSQCALLGDPARAICTASGACGQCAGDGDCTGAEPVCDPVGSRCVGCLTNGDCSGASPICTNRRCTACTAASQCTALADPMRATCASSGACVQCVANSECGGSSPVCDMGSNTCKTCLGDAGCGGSTPLCIRNTCTACTSSTQCAAMGDPQRVVCSPGGACVQCMANSECSASSPICDATTNTCQQCLVSTSCGGNTPICAGKLCTPCTASAQCIALQDPLRVACSQTGACVQCVANSDCGGASPVCDLTSNTCQQCLSDAGCGGATPICIRRSCAGCTASSQCAALGDRLRAVCASSGACVQCLGNSDCGGTTPVCDTTTNTCQQCVASDTCGGNTPICSGKACTACTSSSQCAALRDPQRAACSPAGACVQCTGNSDCGGATPVCDTTTNKCVQCLTSVSCGGNTPICANNVCTACASSNQCASLSNPLRAVCSAAGACVQCTSNGDCSGAAGVCDTATNTCVQCLSSASCSGVTPICSSRVCVGCGAASQCAALADPSRRACASDGSCVQCTDDSTCSGTTPVCAVASRTCRGCGADSECAGRGPGVCMKHQDARCASEDETIVVSPGGTLPNSTAITGKRLVVFRGTVSGTVAWTLAGAPLTVVGQSSGVLSGAGAATMHVTGGEVFMRDLTLTGGSPGLWVDGGAVLRLDHVSVSDNVAGGVLIDGAGLSITNTTISGNGVVNSLDGVWAGLRLQNLPAAATVPKSLTSSTISGNQQVGVSCASGTSSLLSASGVLAANNVGGVDIALACGFSSCGAVSTTCGAQP